MLHLPDGRFRGFVANAITLAIDGATPLVLDGQARPVLVPGPAGSLSECGRWLTSVLPRGETLYGVIHNEQHCRYNQGETHKSMSIARSYDLGLHWNILGQIIGTDGDVSGKTSGIGDCTAVDGHDNYWYAYCLRPRDWKNIVARAPANDPTPGNWNEWNGQGWSEKGLGGTGAPLAGAVGTSAAYWLGAKSVLVLNATDTALRLSLSKDKVNFETLPAPLIAYDANNWQRPAPSDFYAYPAMIADTGFNDIARQFLLAYLYIPPGGDFTQRYLVMQAGEIDLRPTPVVPQVQIALSRWVDTGDVTWTTTGPAISLQRSYRLAAGLGYVMTAAPRGVGSVELDECFSPQTGNGFLTETGTCTLEFSARRRSAGYVYQSWHAATEPLVSCLAKNGFIFISNREDCENMGVRRRILGYALQ